MVMNEEEMCLEKIILISVLAKTGYPPDKNDPCYICEGYDTECEYYERQAINDGRKKKIREKEEAY